MKPTTNSTSILEKVVPIVETAGFLDNQAAESQCKQIADSFRDYGCAIIRDPRVNESHNTEFLNMMEAYFESRGKKYYNHEQIDEIKPEYNYQVGATNEYVEKARDHKETIERLDAEQKPLTQSPPPHDAKWRFFWRMYDDAVAAKKASSDELPQVVPSDFPDWETVMNRWGDLMLGCCNTVAEMLAIGLDLERDTFTSRTKGGNHLLAPTGSDLARYKRGTIFAGFHYGKYSFLQY